MFFVSLIKDILTRQEASRTAEVEFLRGRIIALEDRMLEMKREGFQRPPSTTEYQRDLLDAEVMEAIDSVASEGTTLYSDLLEFAHAEKLMNKPADQIADGIMKGGSHEDFD